MSLKQRFQQNKMKFLTILLLLVIGLIALFWGTFEKTSDTGYCASCHMMKPEYYTWQASSHSQVECVSCHEPPGTLKKVQYKLFALEELYHTISGTYGLQITTTDPIKDESCKQCHNMSTRKVSPSGDLIVPHDKHEQLGVSCVKCHTGVAHGNIAKKRATLRTDYSKWDLSMGKSFMQDEKNVRPDMETCMKCHQVRKATVECKSCHTTSMYPDTHKTDAFKNGNHGKLAAKDIAYCDSCHKYMSKEQVESTKESKAYEKFLGKNTGKTQITTAASYAKTNTFCKDCHSKQPASHKEDLFLMNHGLMADQDKNRCFTCHDNRVMGDSPVTKIACGNCHQNMHKREWRTGHPVDLPARPQVTQFCYTCHTESICSRCHSTGKKP